jgi:pre-mRNA-processing factor 40
MPRLPAGAAPAAIDPNNDVSCWAEHESEAGLKYWYNRVTLVSTYDKPFCLKTPEERAIPPCAWKEYTAADGKKYYSNGKEST